ncbi:IrmA family protein [Pantoea sp. SORGH_AS_0659]|uniref:IrmA family protein n=1 Tax=Pantoea sp. SORGH_AS_0659 TaxID=3062597 RepID=UPI0038620844
MKGSRTILALIALSISGISSAYAEEQRYISIRNTDSVWVPGGICSLQFRLDNGGSGQGFNKLAVTMRVKDNKGDILEEGIMDVEPFGDSDATRSQNAYLETTCNDDASSVEVVKATEMINGKEFSLPLSVFDTQYYKPLTVTVNK